MTTPVLPRCECHPDASGRCHACARQGISFHGIRWITVGNTFFRSARPACMILTSTRWGQRGVGVGEGPNHREAPVDNQVIPTQDPLYKLLDGRHRKVVGVGSGAQIPPALSKYM